MREEMKDRNKKKKKLMNLAGGGEARGRPVVRSFPLRRVPNRLAGHSSSSFLACMA